MRCCGLSDVGKIRKDNEDSFYIQSYDSDHSLAIVADGMGGHKGGKEASSVAVKVISDYINNLLPDVLTYTERKLKHTLIKAIKAANSEVYNASLSSEELSGMGTTAVVCFISKNKLYAINVGDSRLYIINSEITQVTKDHSYVSELLERGVISEQQALNHPHKNVITKALGTEPDIDADIYCVKLDKDDCILLCSDGLTNMVDNKTIINIVNSDGDVDNAVAALVEEAKLSGGNDNITVVMIKLNDGGEN